MHKLHQCSADELVNGETKACLVDRWRGEGEPRRAEPCKTGQNRWRVNTTWKCQNLVESPHIGENHPHWAWATFSSSSAPGFLERIFIQRKVFDTACGKENKTSDWFPVFFCGGSICGRKLGPAWATGLDGSLLLVLIP